MIKYIDELGESHYTIPGIWNNTSPVTWEYLEQNGWTCEEVIESPENYVRVVKYSKRKVMRKMKDMGIWSQARDLMVSNDVWDDWESSQNLSSDDIMFRKMSKQMEKLLPEETTVDDFLIDCELEDNHAY